MKINPLNKNIFSNRINDTFNIFYIFGNNLGLIDICYSKLKKNLEVDLDNPFITNYFDENNNFAKERIAKYLASKLYRKILLNTYTSEN